MEVIESIMIVGKKALCRYVPLTSEYIIPLTETRLCGWKYFGGQGSCVIAGDIQINTQNTLFVLDIKVASLIYFDSDKPPTPQEIYDLYKEAKMRWRYEIMQRGIKEGCKSTMILIENLFLFICGADNLASHCSISSTG